MRIFGEKKEGVRYLTRCGVYLVSVCNQKVALVKTPLGYFLPGGGTEATESHSETLIRELLEETGCQITIGPYLGSAESYTTHYRHGPFHPVQYYYAGMIGSMVRPAIEKDHALVWLSVDEALEQMFVPSQAWAVSLAAANKTEASENAIHAS